MGFILTARWAGISPINVPNITMVNNAPSTNGMGTVGLVYGKSDKSCVTKLMMAKTAAPKIMPTKPAMRVKKTDSNKI